MGSRKRKKGRDRYVSEKFGFCRCDSGRICLQRRDGNSGRMGRQRQENQEGTQLRNFLKFSPKNLLKNFVFSSQKHKKGKKGEEIEMKHRSASAEAVDKQPQSELLAGEMERQSNASVSRSFGQKMLFNALGARESSMVREREILHKRRNYSAKREESRLTTFSLFSLFLCHTRSYMITEFISK